MRCPQVTVSGSKVDVVVPHARHAAFGGSARLGGGDRVPPLKPAAEGAREPSLRSLASRGKAGGQRAQMIYAAVRIEAAPRRGVLPGYSGAAGSGVSQQLG